ncbi:TPA: type II toxin-antitoxin system PemK/MazF family toxin [Enterococcus faecalis]|nr:type II toxin-antitoxin system PemK/MazF family toxin [Enterococcus faecalis]HBI1737525.1 type II toxin-antitoxin system PemK/MazF family toxin [Enterococcus faecalis]HBI1740262.1 type II toxin-antitoxin system PemK/MazF family toxin [Enterococcus faecalis]HBI1743121.1 type II toxin-antitoxin system PemK/MazF family toxin [Enterococcus faecalis]HBI1745920.1 type II toxin-antitoxin system PemK/MazF family toxin [Enterococcus faecalis]
MDRQYYKQVASNQYQSQLKVGSDKKLMSDISFRHYKLTKQVEDMKMKDGIKWCYGYSNYINHQGLPNLTGVQRQRFQRGQIVFVDFFGGFGEELTFDHNAIVLQAGIKGLVVAPITSADRYYQDVNNPLLVQIEQKIRNQGNLLYNSTIRIDQLRYVSRSRILRRHGLVSDGAKLDEISLKIAQYLTPVLLNQMEDKMEKIQQKAEEDVEELNEKIKVLQEENSRLKELISISKENL